MTGQIHYLTRQQRTRELHKADGRPRLACAPRTRRRLAGTLAIAAAVAAGTAPAQARPYDLTSGATIAQPAAPSGPGRASTPGAHDRSPCSETCSSDGYGLDRATLSPQPAAPRAATHGTDLESGYLSIGAGAGAAGLALLSVGGSLTRRRARRQARQHPTIAA